jgi:hypothetical protein
MAKKQAIVIDFAILLFCCNNIQRENGELLVK